MIVPYIRSSLLGTYKLCEHKAFIEYNVGIKSDGNKAAEKGNIVHKVLECLAHQRLCEQNGKKTFVDDALGKIHIKNCDPNELFEKIYAHFVETTDYEWERADYTDCKRWVKVAVTHNDGQFDPRKRDVIMAEQIFDIPIKRTWARYDYGMPDGTRLKNHMAIKGTVDLVTRLDSNTIEIIDWKTGSRSDFASNSFAKKEEKDFYKDPQLRLYHYAACLLYPDDDILMTIFYIKDGGPFTIAFDREDAKQTEKNIKRKFEEINNSEVPKWIAGSKKCNWCSFSKSEYKDSGKTTCQFFHDEVSKKGAAQTFVAFGDQDKVTKYQDGGGRKVKDD